MTYDIWFTRAGSKLIFAFAEHDEAPMGNTFMCTSPQHAINWVKKHHGEVAQVGICPPGMLGVGYLNG